MRKFLSSVDWFVVAILVIMSFPFVILSNTITRDHDPYSAVVVSQYREPGVRNPRPYRMVVNSEGNQHVVNCSDEKFFTLKPGQQVTVVVEKGWLLGEERSRRIRREE